MQSASLLADSTGVINNTSIGYIAFRCARAFLTCTTLLFLAELNVIEPLLVLSEAWSIKISLMFQWLIPR